MSILGPERRLFQREIRRDLSREWTMACCALALARPVRPRRRAFAGRRRRRRRSCACRRRAGGGRARARRVRSGRPSHGAWRPCVFGARPSQCEKPGGNSRPCAAARAAASAAQSHGRARDRSAAARPAAGRLFRYGLPPNPAGIASSSAPSRKLLRRRNRALRLSRTFLYLAGAGDRAAARRGAEAHDRLSSGRRLQRLRDSRRTFARYVHGFFHHRRADDGHASRRARCRRRPAPDRTGRHAE